MLMTMVGVSQSSDKIFVLLGIVRFYMYILRACVSIVLVCDFMALFCCCNNAISSFPFLDNFWGSAIF